MHQFVLLLCSPMCVLHQALLSLCFFLSLTLYLLSSVIQWLPDRFSGATHGQWQLERQAVVLWQVCSALPWGFALLVSCY